MNICIFADKVAGRDAWINIGFCGMGRKPENGNPSRRLSITTLFFLLLLFCFGFFSWTSQLTLSQSSWRIIKCWMGVDLWRQGVVNFTAGVKDGAILCRSSDEKSSAMKSPLRWWALFRPISPSMRRAIPFLCCFHLCEFLSIFPASINKWLPIQAENASQLGCRKLFSTRAHSTRP